MNNMRLSHQVTVHATDRQWFEEFMLAAHERFEAITFVNNRPIDPTGSGGHRAAGTPRVTLEHGRHAHKGARYVTHQLDADQRVQPRLTIDLEDWYLTGTSRVRVRSEPSDPNVNRTKIDTALQMHVRRAPDALVSDGTMVSADASALMKETRWSGTLDFDLWWIAIEFPRMAIAAPVKANIRNGALISTLVLFPTEGPDGWTIDVSCRVRGRHIFRLLLAPMGLFRGRAQAALVTTTDKVAASFNKLLDIAAPMDPQQAASHLWQWAMWSLPATANSTANAARPNTAAPDAGANQSMTQQPPGIRPKDPPSETVRQ
jgi:hypothetical protein